MPRSIAKPVEGEAVRGPIKDMLAAGSEEEFKESLPSQTSSEDQTSPFTAEPKVRKKRGPNKKKDQGDTPVDARLERANAKMSGLGLAQLTEGGFALSGKPLNEQETEDVQDQFYAISKKANVDPSGSWVFVIVYTIILLLRLALSRTELGEQVKSLFADLFKKKEANEQGAAEESQGAAA
jgi:hypothetical protein